MSEGLPRPVRLADGAGLTSMPQRMMVRTLNPTLAKQLSDVATEWTTSEGWRSSSVHSRPISVA